MNARLSASLAVLGTAVSALSAATDVETSRLASIEEQLRNSDGLSNDETNALADQISSITGSITDSTTRLTDSITDVHQAAGSDGSQIAQGGLTGSGGVSSGSESGGITGEQAQFGNASTTQQGGSGQQEQGGEQQEQGGEQPQDPAPQTEG